MLWPIESPRLNVPAGVLVAHHDTLPGVQWDEVVQLPTDTNC